MIFGKRGFIYRLLLVHFAQTFSLSHWLRLIATAVGSYARSRRAAQTRSASTGSRILRRIYGHIVAQGLGAEKLTASWDGSIFPRRSLAAVSQVGVASAIVLMAWLSWPGEAAAPAIASIDTQPPVTQPPVTQSLVTQNTGPALPNGSADAVAPVLPAIAASPQQIAETRERFSALTAQKESTQKESAQRESAQRETVPQEIIQKEATQKEIAQIEIAQIEIAQKEIVQKELVLDDSAEAAIPGGGPLFGAEVPAETTRPTVSPDEIGDASHAADLEMSNGPSRPGGLSSLLSSLAEVTARRQASVGQIVVVAQPTSTPPPQPTSGPAPVLIPGPQWPDFTPAAAPAVDHFWLGQPHPSGYNQYYSPNYQFGSTANERYRIHHGVDIASDRGTPVLAMGEGEVIHAGPDNPALLGPYNNFYGKAVVVRLNRRLPTSQGEQDVYVLLGHLSEVYAERGQQVTPDVVVGAVGMTGIAIGPHLHVEVRVGQNSYLHSVNPALWMQNPPGTGSVAVRLLTADGRSWSDARLSLLRYEGGGTRWVRTVEIYPDAENISADPAWGENGALSQLSAGGYWLGGVVNGEKIGQNITIYPGETTFIELRTEQ